MQFTLTVNGKQTRCEAAPEAPLLETLRGLGLYSVRSGCESANCGVCTVWLDEKPVLSCSVPTARAAGHRVTTVEGVQEEATALADHLAAEGADQCGYCAPGLIMSVLAMKRELTSYDDASSYTISTAACAAAPATRRSCGASAAIWNRKARPEGGLLCIV